MTKINNFGIVRLLLAILVFFYNWNILTNQHISLSLFHLGSYAVDMFFIVSGFLIFWSFDNDQNKKHFYIKRFFRIYPLYIILILIQTIFFVLYSNENFNQIAKYFLTNSLFLNFLSPSIGNIFSYSLYILHFPLIQLFLYFDLNPLLSFMSIFSILLLLSYLSEKFIEKKFILMGKNLIKKGVNI